MVILETDPAIARAIGRRVLGHSTVMPNYRASFLRMGFTAIATTTPFIHP